jgi:hypothetical protein
MEAVEQEE